MKVCVGLLDICSYLAHIQKGLVELGFQCDGVDITEEDSLVLSPKSKGVLPKILKKNNGWYRKWKRVNQVFSIPFKIIEMIGLVWLFCIYLFKYDCFIFAFDKSFLPLNLDLPILKLFKKKVVFVFHGSDVRPPYTGAKTALVYKKGSVRSLKQFTKRTFKKIRWIERYSDCVISSPFISQFFSKPVVSWYAIGIPHDLKDFEKLVTEKSSETIRIVHAPSAPLIKGTDRVRASINKLKKKGYSIDYVEVKGVPRDKILETLQSANIVIDQLYSECFWSTTAMEASMFAKPTIVCGNVENDLIKQHLDKVIPHRSFFNNSEFETVLENWVRNREERDSFGKIEQQFLRGNWDYKEVAKRMNMVLQKDIPSSWWVDPYKITYIHGGACSKQMVVKMVSDLVAKYGEKALYLEDKMLLKKELLAWVAKNKSV